MVGFGQTGAVPVGSFEVSGCSGGFGCHEYSVRLILFITIVGLVGVETIVDCNLIQDFSNDTG